MKTRFELEVKGDKKPFNVGLISLGKYQQAKGFSFEDFLINIQTNSFLYIPDIMYWSMEFECKRKGVSCISNDDFIDWIDEKGYNNDVLVDFTAKLLDCLNDSLPQQETNKPQSKKK